MATGKIVIDKSSLPPSLMRKLEAFFLENSLAVEEVNVHIPVTSASLGQGGAQILLFEGEALCKLHQEKRMGLWKCFMETFNLFHLTVSGDKGVHFFWQTRLSSPSELDYQEIRRIHIYNPTSYKRKARIPGHKNFALMKVAERVNAKVMMSPELAEMELLPSGIVSLDYGVFS